MSKTIKDYEDEKALEEKLKLERELSNKFYARKEVEYVLVWAGAIVVGALLVAIANSVLK